MILVTHFQQPSPLGWGICRLSWRWRVEVEEGVTDHGGQASCLEGMVRFAHTPCSADVSIAVLYLTHQGCAQVFYTLVSQGDHWVCALTSC